MSGRHPRHSPAFSLLEAILMTFALGIVVMLLAAMTRPLWWDHAKGLLGRDSPPATTAVESATKK